MPDFNPAVRDLIRRSLGLLLFVLCLLQIWTVWNAPPRYRPQSITLKLAPGESQILGRQELAAGQAQGRHIQISRAKEGEWGIQNLTANRQVLLQMGANEIALPKSANGQIADGFMLKQGGLSASGMIIGHTHFKLTLQEDHLRMEPIRRVSLFNAPKQPLQTLQPLPPTIIWQWQQDHTWQLPLNAYTAVLLLVALLLGIAQRYHRWHVFAAGGVAISAAFALFSTPTLAQSLVLCWLGPMLWLSLPNRRNLASALAMNLLGIGLFSQLELGLGGMESSWLGYYHKSAALQALALGAAALAAPLLSAHIKHVPKLKTVEMALLLLALLALASMALEVFFGNEGGVFGIQPVELAKLALVALTAHVLALCTRQSFPRRWLVWRLLCPVAVVFGFVSLALIHVSDYSPLLLLLIWATLCILAYALANGWNRTFICLLLCVLCLPVGIFGLRSGLLQIPGQFYPERFLVWLAPSLHPHTGYQFLQGAQAIIEGGWFGADQAFGLTGLGSALGGVMQIPSVQDDFALAFFLNRHGLLAAFLLWLLQAGLMFSLFYRAWSVWQTARALQDFRRVWHARFYSFVLVGGAGFLFGQLLLSWGTNLGILPVMGQPMSFLSSGGSHLFFFLLPLLSFYTLYAPTLEESPSCPPMSTTRY